MTKAEIHQLVDSFVAATERSHRAGFDVVELHSAHGYLLHQFLSPISNQRTDEFGGDYKGRTALHRLLVRKVREVWPSEKPLFMRISATDWIEGAWSLADTIRLSQELKDLGLDLMDCSSGGSTMDAPIPNGPGYQVHLAEGVKQAGGLLAGAVGAITTPEQANAIVDENRADLIFIGRELLRDPHWANRAATALGAPAAWPNQYEWAVKN
jgi:2,4-dienoyl-CoA reductase-like NADH-dependent reductase (Old Yellow Enzyme family)